MKPHFQHCADQLRKDDYGRYISCLFLESGLREAAFALYAFHSKVNEISTLVSEPMPGEIRIQWWMDIVADAKSLSADPIARALQETIVHHHLPVERLQGLLQAHIFDLYQDPMPDSQALETYLGETHSCIFLLLCTIAARTGDVETMTADACGHAGVFTGTVGLLKKLPFHVHQQQDYFPSEISSQFKIEKLQGTAHTCVRKAWLEDIYQYANQHQRLAMKSISCLHLVARLCFVPVALSDLELNHMIRRGISLDTIDAAPSNLAIVWKLWRAKRKLAKMAANT